jgi:hypothetical protein
VIVPALGVPLQVTVQKVLAELLLDLTELLLDLTELLLDFAKLLLDFTVEPPLFPGPHSPLELLDLTVPELDRVVD